MGDDGFVVRPEDGVSENMRRYLVWFLCQETGVTPDQIKPGKGLRNYGVDSIVSTRLMHGFETYFRVRATGRELFEHGTIESLLAHLARKVEAENGHAPPAEPAQPEPDNGTQARAEYKDAQVIEALERLERGTLDLEAVQRLIDN